MTPSDLQQVMDAYQDAVYARNVPAFMALYDGQVRVFDLWETWVYDRAAWQGAATQWFGSLGNERVAVVWSEVQTHAGAEIATLSALITYLSGRIGRRPNATGHAEPPDLGADTPGRRVENRSRTYFCSRQR